MNKIIIALSILIVASFDGVYSKLEKCTDPELLKDSFDHPTGMIMGGISHHDLSPKVSDEVEKIVSKLVKAWNKESDEAAFHVASCVGLVHSQVVREMI
jgi:hypothetical protein